MYGVLKSSHYAFYTDWNNKTPGYFLESEHAKLPVSAQLQFGLTISFFLAKWCIERQGKKKEGNETKHIQTISSSNSCPVGCPDCIEAKSCIAEIHYFFRWATFVFFEPVDD